MRNLFLAALILAAVVSASPIWLAGDVTFQTKYIWRGAVFNDNAVLQPWVAAGAGGAAVTFWGNMDLTDKNTYIENDEEQDPTGKFTEIDLILNYTHNFGALSVTAGYNKYWYPNTSYSETAASEVTLSAGYDCLLYPTLTTAISLEDAEGLYTALTLSHGEALSSLVSAGISLNLGFGNEEHNAYYYGVPASGLADLTVNLSAPVSFPCGIIATPSVEFTSLLDSEVSDAFTKPSNLRGGLSLTYYFL